MVRAVITPDQQQVIIKLPESFIGKEVEVIAFTTDEGFAVKEASEKKRTFTILNIDNKDFKFDRDEANER